MHVELTNVEQFQRAKTKGGVGDNRFEDIFNKGKHFDEEPNMDMLKENEQGLPLVTLQLYQIFSQKLFTTAKQAFLVEKKGKDNIVLANV